MLDIPSITGIVAAVGVIVGVAFTVLELRNLVKQRQTDLIVHLYSTFATEEFQKDWHIFMTDTETNDYNTFLEKYAVEIPPIGLFFHQVGVLLEKKLIDFGIASSMFGVTFIRYWERVKPVVEDARRQLNAPRWGYGAEYLYNEMKKRQQKPQPTTV